MKCSLVSVLALAAPALRHRVEGKEATYVLAADHPSHAWRTAAGYGQPTMHKVVLWTRHEQVARVQGKRVSGGALPVHSSSCELFFFFWLAPPPLQVGIGNALGGFARVMEDALNENRTLVVTSLILQKFCEVVACGLVQLPGSGYEPRRGVDQTRASHFQISVAGPESTYLKKWYRAAGCGGPPPLPHYGDAEWGRKCFYSTLVRSLVTGPGVRLAAEQGWLRQHYVGSPARFDQVGLRAAVLVYISRRKKKEARQPQVPGCGGVHFLKIISGF